VHEETKREVLCVFATLRLRGGDSYWLRLLVYEVGYNGDICPDSLCKDGRFIKHVFPSLVEDSDHKLGVIHLEPG